MNKEQLQNQIEVLKAEIEVIKNHNEDSGELSFLYYQLHELEKELQGQQN